MRQVLKIARRRAGFPGYFGPGRFVNALTGAALLALSLGVGQVSFGAGQAHAQDGLDALDLDLSGYAVGVMGSVDDSAFFNDDDLRFGADAQIAFSGSYLFENGIEVGVGASGNLEEDPGRSLAAGFVPLSAPLNKNCAIGPDAAAVGIVCAFVEEEEDDFVRDSFLFVEGFFGEVRFGRQQGVAHEMSYLPPNLFFATAVNDWETDLTGINTINTRNTVNNGFDDYAFRVNYTTPRVLGAQLGISYAPNTDSCGATLCPTSVSRLFPDYDDVVEVGINYFYTFSNGLSVGVSGTYLAADTEGTPKVLAALEDYQSWNFGANLKTSGFTFGASFKQNNLGRDGVDYTAYDVGATYETGPWGFMVAYGGDTNGLTGQDTEAIQGGVGFTFDNIGQFGADVSIGAGFQYVEGDGVLTLTPDGPGGSSFGPSVSGVNEDATVIFLETMVSF